jgi:hypothetical protein
LGTPCGWAYVSILDSYKEVAMRKCVVLGIALFAVSLFTPPTRVSAQGVFLGGGATIPTGDYGDYADVGWMAEAGISFPMNEEGVYLFGDGLYGSNSHSDHEGDKTNLLGILGGVELDLSEEGSAGVFLFAEAGILRHTYKSDEFPDEEGTDTGFAFGAGAGYGFPLGETLNGWVLGRYLQGQFDGGNTAFVGLMAGVSFAVGGNAG